MTDARAASGEWVARAKHVPIEGELARRGIRLKRQGKELVGPCPKCSGTDRFAVHLSKQEWHCRGCAKGGDIIALLQHLDGVDFNAACESLTGEPRPSKPNGKDRIAEQKIVAAAFEYQTAAGATAFVVERIEYQNPDGSFVKTKDGKRKKTFRQKRPDPDRPGAWIWNVDGVSTVPYRLVELIEAVGNEHVILIAEGEAKVDLLRAWNVPATCCVGGAEKWRPEHSEFLAGADVVVLPDNDDAGRKHADGVAEALQGIAASVKVLELPGLPSKGDIIDWAAAGGSVEQLHELIEHEAKPWVPGTAKGNPPDLPAPHPLPDSLLPVDPFDFDLLPDQLQPWVADVCERMQCPPDYVAVSLMAALGSMIGRKVAIRPQSQDDWQIICNQWALLIGRPGVLKSPAMEESLRPVRKLAAKAEESLKKERAAYEVTAAAAKLRHDENIKQAAKILRKDRNADVSSLLEAEDECEEPTLKRYVANDTSVASLGVLLQQNPNGLLVFRDEIVSLLDNLDREEYVSDRGFYLTAWNGDSNYVFDRIGRGLHLSIPGVCLSMLGSTQPGRIAQYLTRAIRGGRGDDGLIQRFGLMVWPDVSPEWRLVDRWPDQVAKNAAMAVFERLDALDWRAIGAKRDRGPGGDEEGLPYLRFSIEAYDLFMTWRRTLEARLRSGELHVALEAHLAKYRKLVPGLCLICHLADGLSGPVGVAAIRRGIAWAKYLETHAQRAYGSVTAAAADTAKAILAKIAQGAVKPEFRSHDIWRPGWSRLKDREAVHAGLAMLLDYDWLTVRKVETMGRPQTVYALNPKAQIQPIGASK